MKLFQNMKIASEGLFLKVPKSHSRKNEKSCLFSCQKYSDKKSFMYGMYGNVRKSLFK